MKRKDRARSADLVRRLCDVRKYVRSEGRPLKERRYEARERDLPLSRECPVCRCVKLRSRQWIVLALGSAICKSCYMLRRVVSDE